MKRILFSILLAACLLFPHPISISAYPPAIPLVERVTRSIVRLEANIEEHDHPICTAFVVSATKGQALTAAHCVPEGATLYADGEPTHLIRQDGLFALVAVPVEQKPPLDLRKGEMKVGEDVWTVGFAWGDYTVLKRQVASFLRGDVLMDGPLAPGMSGGPVVDAKGDVAGVNQASNNVLGVACGVQEIKAFLAR